MPKETNITSDFAERSVTSNGMDFDFDIGVRDTGGKSSSVMILLKSQLSGEVRGQAFE
jgi:hypothetical protein